MASRLPLKQTMDFRLASLVWLVHVGSSPHEQGSPQPESPEFAVKELATNTFEVTPFEWKPKNPQACPGHRERWEDVIRRGQLLGFRVKSVHPASLLRTLGFRFGDVVTAINDTLMTSPDALLVAYTASRMSPRIKVKVEREGRMTTLTYLIRPTQPAR